MNKLLVSISLVVLALPAIAGAAADDMTAARDAVASMDKASGQVAALVQNAKANKDSIRLTCLDEKAKQITGLAGGAHGKLDRAGKLAGGQQQVAVQEILADAKSVETLRAAAASCVGTTGKATAAASRVDGFNAIDPSQDAAALGTQANSGAPALPQPGSTVPNLPPASPTR